MEKFSYLDHLSPRYIEEMYTRYKSDPVSVDSGWQKFFEGFEFAQTDFSGNTIIPDELKVINLILAYRQRGHLFTKTNPVRTRRHYFPTLDIENFELKQEDLEKEFTAGSCIGLGKTSLKNIIDHLNQTYCNSVAVEYFYIRVPEIVEWLRIKMESCANTPTFSEVKKLRILSKLNQAVYFEKFVHKKYPGQKSFSLEGCETLIPALHYLIEKGSENGIEEFVIGMSHRGRLNVLTNILYKPVSDILAEFKGVEFDESLLGDVKYHLGHSAERLTDKCKPVQLGLVPNPSHLESVDPVVEGIVRARADQQYSNDYNKIVPVLIHGDAAIAGQGVVYEVLQMSQLEGYKTGGSIHLIVNNQIGFTTNYTDGRSSVYCSDIAKILQVPIFHVNADDVEAVVYVVELAMEFRQIFHRDVFIDLLGYRRFGHNESDEPRFTQPTLYKLIENHPDPSALYANHLASLELFSETQQKEAEGKIYQRLEKAFTESEQMNKEHITPFYENILGHLQTAKTEDFTVSPETGVDEGILKLLSNKITELPSEKPFFKKIRKIIEERREMVIDKGITDWAMAEHLAFASLLNEGYSVRLSGQDAERGTFSQRHAVLTIDDSIEKYIPLNKCNNGNTSFRIYNSPLNEYGILGFEYGYSMVSPDMLTLWEAQFGDFSNGAQIIIDQYISAAEEKWNVQNGLVLLLPHGYEGQGPEHSSARMERFLSLCANNNMQVVNCTTPANYFHVLRRQMKRDFRVPLIIFTPKSLLRHPKCISSIEYLSQGKFTEVIDDAKAKGESVKRLLFCSGKIYYDLSAYKEKINISNTAIIRLEQLYPFPDMQIGNILKKYNKVSEIFWVQEEPKNMGAWYHAQNAMADEKLSLISRPASGTPAVGSGKMHQHMQQEIIEKAFS